MQKTLLIDKAQDGIAMKKVNKGFTLVEVIVAMAIFSIVVIGLLYAVTFAYTLQHRSVTQFNINGYSNSIVNYIKTNNSITFDGDNITEYEFYFNTGDELVEKLKTLTPGIETNTGGRKIKATIKLSKYNSVDVSNLLYLWVQVKDLSRNGRTVTKEYYVDR